MNRLLAFALTLAAAACVDAPKDPRNFSDGKADSDSDWCHYNLTATEGVEISLDYQVKHRREETNSVDASPLWINVGRDDFGPEDNAAAVIVKRIWSTECGAHCRDNYSFELGTDTVELAFENGRFTGELPDLKIQEHYPNSNGAGDDALNEIAIVVNDVWYKGDDGRNLRFIPTDAPGYCAHGTTF